MFRLVFTLAVLSLAGFGDTWYDNDRFPSAPIESVTPGSLCERPDYYRYPEKIPYCNRAVESSLKYAIMREYDAKFGFEITRMNRQDFKIDHFIPLCMGGSNARSNLWPQHKSIYVNTDLIEQRSCELMAKGRMQQDEAVRTIQYVKRNLQDASKILIDLNNRLRN